MSISFFFSVNHSVKWRQSVKLGGQQEDWVLANVLWVVIVHRYVSLSSAFVLFLDPPYLVLSLPWIMVNTPLGFNQFLNWVFSIRLTNSSTSSSTTSRFDNFLLCPLTQVVYGLIRDQQYHDAIKILQNQLQARPSNIAALSLLAYCQYHIQDYEAASETVCY